MADGLCGYTEEVSTARFVYISAAGGVALSGFLSNVLLFFVFTSHKKSAHTPPNHYPAALAALDALLCLFFLLIFVVDANMLYLKNEELFLVYHEYIIVTFTATKITQLLIPYMLMLATLERYTWITKKQRKLWLWSRHGRSSTILALVAIAVLIRVPAALSLQIAYFPDCPDFFRRIAVDIQDWAKESESFVIFDVYIIALLQTFLPFIALLTLNVTIVYKLTRTDEKVTPYLAQRRERSSFQMLSAISIRMHNMSATARNALFTMVAIVFTYLISSSLHIILTVMEVARANILIDADDPYKASALYTILGDVVSVCYMTSSAVRIVLYAKCNPIVRKQLKMVAYRIRKHTTSSHGSEDDEPLQDSV